MRFVSYAQEFEDLILYVVLRNVKKGFYIDVGANDPIDLSVTKAFYDMGWNGINIEPLISKCELLEQERPRDINLCIGCGDGKADELYLTTAGTGSTFSQETVINSKYESRKKFKKHIMTLTEIYKHYCIDKQVIHFCKIDVEGFEKEVLMGVDFKILRPWVYAMESTIPNTDIPCFDKWENILLDNGYAFAYENGINRYYVDLRKEYLIQYFEDIKGFVESNQVMKMKLSNVLDKKDLSGLFLCEAVSG